MKKILITLTGLLLGISTYSQIIFSEQFSNVPIGSKPTGWEVSSNTSNTDYARPYDCYADTGFQTPAVGQHAPTRMILPSLNYDASKGIISIRFKVFVFDANMECGSAKDFPCATYVTVMLVNPSYTSTQHLPAAADIYAQQSYRIAIANGDNTIIFNNPALTNGQPYRIYFDFKTAETDNCTSGGTRFLFDDFFVEKSDCSGNCPPVASNDYFDGNRQKFFNTLSGNVYGGFARWSSQAPAGYELKSLSVPPAVNDGLDYDANNHDLSTMQFVLVSGPTVVSTGNCSTTPGAGSLDWNSNGTFTYTRSDVCVSRVSFQYKIIDPTALESATATVTIDFTLYFPLAVNFSSFHAARRGNEVQLTWQTTSERNAMGFYVQRNTGNGFINRVFMPSSAPGGISDQLITYNYRDENAYRGLTQYRIAQLDRNGSFSYSSIVVISDRLSELVQVYPNPSGTGNVNVVLPLSSHVFDLLLLDAQGRKITEWKRISETLFTIDHLSSGIYFLRVSEASTGNTTTIRMVITR